MSVNPNIEQNGNVVHQPGAVANSITEVLNGVGEVKSALESIKAEQGAFQNASTEAIVNLTKSLAEVVETQSKAVAASEQARINASEAERYDALTSDKFLSKFNDLSASEQAKVIKELGAEFGAKNVEVALSKSWISKAISRPVTEKTQGYDEIKAVRKAVDFANRFVAMAGGMTEDRVSGDVIVRDEKTFQQALDRLAASGDAELAYGVDILRGAKKGINDALDTVTATEGLEWVPTIWSADMVDKMYYELRVASLFNRVIMPNKTFRRPVKTAKTRAYRMPEQLTNSYFSVLATDHTFETGNMEFVAEKLAVLQFFSDELASDSIVPLLQIANEEAIYGLTDAIEDACINGDIVTTAGHLDTTWWTGTADARGMWDGFRKNAQASAALRHNFGGALNLNLLRDLRKKMKEFNDVSQLVLIVAPETAVELLKLPEVLTIDKFGANATVLRGQIGSIDSIPIVVSGKVPITLNAAGAWDAAGTLTGVIFVHRQAYEFADRQLVRVESDRNPLAGQRYVLSTWRGDFQRLYPAAEPCMVYGHNVLV